MENELSETRIINEPVHILWLLSLWATDRNQIGYDNYYTLYRLRHLLTLDVLCTKEAHNILLDVIGSNYAMEFIRLLDEFELLRVVFPSIHALKGIDGGHYHNEEVFTHVLGALKAIQHIKLPVEVKLASLYHDCGKIRYEDFEDGRRRFTNHATLGEQLVEGDLRRLKFDGGIISMVKSLVGLHMRQIDGKKSLRGLVRELEKQKIPLKYFIWLRYSDNKGSMKSKTDFMFYWRMYKESLKILYPKHIPCVADLAISGDDLLRESELPAGKWIGDILRDVFNKWQDGELENTYGTLMEYVREKMCKL